MLEAKFESRSTAPGFSREPTDIDRRKCIRTVDMEVLCLGLGRTGTSSIRQALFKLGYFDVYHMYSCTHENPRDIEMWKDAFNAKYEGIGKQFTRSEWDRLLGHCQAVTDYPGAAFAPELMDAYPEAKVILNVRDSPASWKKSIIETIWPAYEVFGPCPAPHIKMLKWITSPFLPKLKMFEMIEVVFKHTLMPDFPERGEELYPLHNDEVLAHARLHDREVLVFNVKEGWAPLCTFLGKPVPVDADGNEVPFPRVNDAKTFNKDGKKQAGEMISEWFWSKGVYLYAAYIAGFAALTMAWKNQGLINDLI